MPPRLERALKSQNRRFNQRHRLLVTDLGGPFTVEDSVRLAPRLERSEQRHRVCDD